MTTDGINKAVENSFSFAIDDSQKGQRAILITLFGDKTVWEAKLRESFEKNLNANGCDEILENILNQLPESISESIKIELVIRTTEEVEDVIADIAEIPQVLKTEGARQPVIYLTKTINGKARNVVMMGEVHIATKEEARAAKRILPYFQYFGCEGIDSDGFIEGKFFFWVMDYIMTPFVNYVFHWGRRSNKNISSINKASEYAFDLTTKKKVWWLEKGWKPSIRMRLFYVFFPVWFFWSLYNTGSLGVKYASLHGFWWGPGYIFGTLLFWVLVFYTPILGNALKYLFGIMLDYVFDLGPSRNRNMTKNLMANLCEDNSVDSVLVLTGANHTRPMAKILKRKYGFKEFSIP